MLRMLSYYRDVLREAELLVDADITLSGGSQVKSLTYDSREAEPGTLFICKGAAFRPEYLESARRAGAVCYVSETRLDPEEPMDYLLVRDIRKAMAVLAREFYEKPEQALHVTGITGTKGKTTTTYYLKSILDAFEKSGGNRNTAILSSIESYDGVKNCRAEMTTPEAPQIYRHMRTAVNAGLHYFTMEVSSQALKYDRVRGLIYDVGIFLNISEDHISPKEHPDFEDYFHAKLSLFHQTRTACVGVDSDHADRILRASRMAERVITFGIDKPADIVGYDVSVTQEGISFRARCDRFDEKFSLAMHGFFNVENALAAIAAAYAYDVPVEYMKKGLEHVRVSGRMEQYESADGKVLAVVDFAHNRLSFERLYDAIYMEHPGRRVVTVFGCPGDKALNRRRDLGLIAGTFSHRVYLTADDPGMERVDEISREVQRYVEMVGCPCECIADRGEAVRKAIADCEEPTVVLILGKGNEGHQKFGMTVYPYPTDAQLVRQALAQSAD